VGTFAESIRHERCAVAASCRRSLSHPGCFVVRMCGRLCGVMCAAIRRRAPALACGESRATTLAAARWGACADHAFRPVCLGVVVNYST
jgi:hypothetical protein